MKLHSVCLGILLATFGLPQFAAAQSYWILSYRGTATASGTGKLVQSNVTERTFIEKCAADAGISSEGLALVLHFDANDVGDALEVINVNDPNLFRCEVFKLAFSESYTNNTGSALKRFAYIYDETSAHSRGSAVINQRAKIKRGELQTPTVDGRLHYWLGVWDESVPDTNAVVCIGTFKATRKLLLP